MRASNAHRDLGVLAENLALNSMTHQSNALRQADKPSYEVLLDVPDDALKEIQMQLAGRQATARRLTYQEQGLFLYRFNAANSQKNRPAA